MTGEMNQTTLRPWEPSKSPFADWHVGKLFVLGGIALAMIAFGASIENGGIVLLGLILGIFSVVATWQWMSAREKKPQAASPSDADDEREIVECLAWGAVAAMRRVMMENEKLIINSQLGRRHLREESFALFCAIVRHSLQVMVRANDARRDRIFVGFLHRFSALLDPTEVDGLKTLHRLDDYWKIVLTDDVSSWAGKFAGVFSARMHESPEMANAIVTVIGVRFLKHVIEDILCTAIAPSSGEPMRMISVRFPDHASMPGRV